MQQEFTWRIGYHISGCACGGALFQRKVPKIKKVWRIYSHEWIRSEKVQDQSLTGFVWKRNWHLYSPKQSMPWLRRAETNKSSYFPSPNWLNGEPENWRRKFISPLAIYLKIFLFALEDFPRKSRLIIGDGYFLFNGASSPRGIIYK